jgi:DNA-binding MarR family transcriptional regulator
MIRRLLFAAAAFAVSLLAASPAEAQLNLRGLRFPASLQNIFLLRGDAVQTELGFKDEQKTAISELALALQQEAFEIMSGLQDLTPEEQKEQMPEVMKMIAEKGTEIQGKVDAILDDQQKARLKELSVQARGPQALEDEEISKALKITDEQKKKLEEIREEGNAAMQEAMTSLRAGGGDQGKMREKMGAMRKELSDKALAVLTPEQKEQFEKLKGKEFKFPTGRGGGGGLPF